MGVEEHVSAIQDIIFTNTEDLITVTTTIHTIEICTLIDTGASLNYISLSLFEEVQSKTGEIEWTPSETLVSVANKQRIKCLGSVNLPVEIKNKCFIVKFLAMDSLLYHLILGCKWLKQNRITIDMEHGALIFSSDQSLVIMHFFE